MPKTIKRSHLPNTFTTWVAPQIIHKFVRVIAHTSTILVSESIRWYNEPKLDAGVSTVKYLSYVKHVTEYFQLDPSSLYA